jgi:hypothetical protein
MTSKEEKRRRTKLVEAMVQEETKKAIERMPISFKDLAALLDHLDERLGVKGCDHTPNMTKAFLIARGLDAEVILPWLGEYGGYCDCEVLANVEESWEDEIEKHT